MNKNTNHNSSSVTVDSKPKSHLQAVASRAYVDQNSRTIQNRRVTEFLHMVPKIARKVVSYLKPPLSFEDLVSAGTVGLVKAARDYDPSYQAEFKTYAYIRIKGAILDELRSWTFVPPNLNKRIQETARITRRITNEKGSPPTDSEIAKAMDISLNRLYETMKGARAQHFISIHNLEEDKPALGSVLAAADTTMPEDKIQQAELVDHLAKAIRTLTERQRQIILLYYQKNMNMKQIAKVFDITEPRVSQLHARALFNLLVKLKEYKDVE